MFKRFVPAEDVSSVTAVKSSAVRAMKRSICDTYPAIEEFIDDILPKKGDFEVKEGKGKDRLTFAVVNGEPLFFRVREGPYFPTLKLLHKCAWLAPTPPRRRLCFFSARRNPPTPPNADPTMMARVRADKGAVKFLLKGADVMCPGLTSAGGEVSAELPALAPVAVYAEGKEHALALGTMSGAEVRSVNKGIGIEVLHFAGDDLWKCGSLE